MTIPSFGNYAPKPDLAGAYLGGARIAQARESSANEMQLGQQRLAQAAQQAQQEIQLAQQKIAAQQAQAQMEMQAKQEIAQQNMLRQQQELQIEQADKQARLGLEQRRVEEAEKMVQLKVGEAARKFQAQQAFQRESQELISGGMDAEKAFSQTALKYGPMLGIPGSAYTRAGVRPPAAAGADFGGASPVAGLPEGYRQVQTGPSSRQIIKIPDAMEQDAEATPIVGAPGKAMFNGKVITVKDEPEVVAARKRLAALEAAQDKDPAKAFVMQSEDGTKLSKGKQMMVDAYKARSKEISELKQELKRDDKSPTKASQFEGKRVRSKKTGKMGRVVDGEFVPDEE